MTDTEILAWLVANNAIDTPQLAFHKIMRTEGVYEVDERLADLETGDDS